MYTTQLIYQLFYPKRWQPRKHILIS